MLSDWHKETVKSYNVFNAKQEIAIRSVFLVNKQGTITFLNTAFDAGKKEHYQQVLEEIQKLQ